MSIKHKICAWCGAPAVDMGHVPTKFLIPIEDRKKLKGSWPKLPACFDCNQRLKSDEEFFVLTFSSLMLSLSDRAEAIFNGPLHDLFVHNPNLAVRFNNYLKLVRLKVNEVDYGLKTQINIPPHDWRRMHKVAEFYARGLYTYHTGKSAAGLLSRTVYLNNRGFQESLPHIRKLTPIPIFPGVFEYAYHQFPSNDEWIIFLQIYGKPSYLVFLVTEERYYRSRHVGKKKKRTEKRTKRIPSVEIFD